MHALLQHFERVGFDGATALSRDRRARTRDPHASSKASPHMRRSPRTTTSSGSSGSFCGDARGAGRLRAARRRALATPSRGRPTGEVICHDDLFWTNVVFRDRALPAVLIDWDLAKPAPRSRCRTGASYWAPLSAIDRKAGGSRPTVGASPLCGSSVRRLWVSRSDERTGPLDEVVRRRQFGYEARTASGAAIERRPRLARDVGRRERRRFAANMRWLEDNRSELERWLT